MEKSALHQILGIFRKPAFQPNLDDWFNLLHRINSVLGITDDDPRVGYTIRISGQIGLTVNINQRRVLAFVIRKNQIVWEFIINEEDIPAILSIPGLIGQYEPFFRGKPARLVKFSTESKPYQNADLLRLWEKSLVDSLSSGQRSPFKRYHLSLLFQAAENAPARSLLLQWVHDGNPTAEDLASPTVKETFGDTILKLEQTWRKNIVPQDSFTWVPIFQELSGKLAEYESNQAALIQIIKDNHPMPDANLEEEESAGHKTPLSAIDPFTFFAFITKIKDYSKRTQYLTKLQEVFQLESSIPVDYPGVPTANAQKLWFFPSKSRGQGFEMGALWRLFVSSQEENVNPQDFADCLKIHAVGTAKLTQGLFWTNPEVYFPIDSQTIPFLKRYGINPDFSGWSDYQHILAEVADKFQKPFYEVSALAWKEQNTPENMQPVRYWLVGSTYNSGKEDQLDRFVTEGIWENGFDQKYTVITKSVQPGDKIAIKSTFTVGPTGQKQGMGRVKATGVVTENYNDGFMLKVDWAPLPETIELPALSSYRKTIEELKDKNLLEKIFQTGATLPSTIDNKKNMALNIILYGPPGTGKTYNSIDLAIQIIDGRSTGSHSGNKKRFDELRNIGQIEFVTFHQNYSYEDFVIGLRPVPEATALRFESKPGIFLEISRAARENWKNSQVASEVIDPDFEEVFNSFFKKLIEEEETGIEIPMQFKKYTITGIDSDNGYIKFTKSSGGTGHDLIISIVKGIYEGTRNYRKDGLGIYYFPLLEQLKEHAKSLRKEIKGDVLKKFVLIIDEINRANISRVFGELITLLEEDKRLGAANELIITLPNGEKGFGVPPNLHIIGTMNTADKSIALIDIALRRRFEFRGYYPTIETLEDLEQTGLLSASGRKLLQAINNGIFNKKKTADFLIGHAYLIGKTDANQIQETILNKIIPLLMEYFSGNTDEVSKLFIGSGWNAVYRLDRYTWVIEQEKATE